MRQAISILAVCALALAMSCVAQAKENEAEQEVTVKFADLPQVVQTTFKEEARGATITEVEKETEKGETVYEAEVTIKGKKYEIEVAEDGTLIEKSLSDDDDDEEDDDDDDDAKSATKTAK